MRKSTLLVFSLLNLLAITGWGQSWDTLGDRGFSDTLAECYQFLALSKGDTPFVAYGDWKMGGRATVKKFNGTGWEYVGTQGFSDGEAEWLSVAISMDGTPYVVFRDCNLSYRATVMKFNGVSWVHVGSPGFSAGEVECTRIAIDESGTPYIIYTDFAYGKKPTVKKFNGASWVNVGGAFATGDVFYTQIEIGRDGLPYIAFQDGRYDYKATVMKYNGASWVNIGTEGFTAATASQVCMVLDKNNNPYIAYQDGRSSPGITVMRHDGTHWVTVGSPGVSAGAAHCSTLALDSNNTLYVTFVDGSVNEGAVTVKKYDGYSWVQAGDFLNMHGSETSIAIDKIGNVYVACRDGEKHGRITVVKMGTFLPAITGKNSACVNETVTLSNVVSNGVWSSSNTDVAGVDIATGTVTCVDTGTVTIVYTCGGKMAIHRLTIGKKPAAGLLVAPERCVFPGDTVMLFTTEPGGKWTSADTQTARITTEGLLTAISSGTVDLSYIVSNACGDMDTTFSFSICRLASITTFPVPNHGSFKINILSSKQEKAIVIVTDRFGAKIKEFSISTNIDSELQLDAAAGIYFVRAVTSQGEQKCKIVLQ
jgi:hypothetical protein